MSGIGRYALPFARNGQGSALYALIDECVLPALEDANFSACSQQKK